MANNDTDGGDKKRMSSTPYLSVEIGPIDEPDALREDMGEEEWNAVITDLEADIEAQIADTLRDHPNIPTGAIVSARYSTQ